MNFLPDVTISCEGCGGNRFDQETLSVRVHDQSVADLLEMDTKEAAEFFVSHPRIGPTLNLLVEVGLGYLKLGQPSPTLSGGEAQRIKIVAELARRAPVHVSGTGRRGTLYVLDEPTIGLHMADVERLTRVLHRLADRGHTVVVIEHNLDMIAEADHIIDLGPDAGDGGGHLVAIGSPEEVAAVEQGSYTALALSSFLRERVV
jgi:excinuclease ABC subunit A